ncbi:MAG: hypothetical protein BJ554DRAFT_4233, partial [Olpidium bornovanus]
PPRPGVPEVRVELHGLLEPAAGLFVFALLPEQPRHRDEDMGVVVALFERVHRLRAPLVTLFEQDGFRPHQARVGAFLQGCIRVSCPVLHANRLHPHFWHFGIEKAASFQDSAGLYEHPCQLLQPAGKKPERNALRAGLEAFRVRLARRGYVAVVLVVDLAADYVQLVEIRVLHQRLVEQLERLVVVAQLPLENNRFHPYALGIRSALSSVLQERPSPLVLTGLPLELHCRQPDLLAFRVHLERLGEDSLRARNVAGQPPLLGSHEPKHLGPWAELDCSLEQLIERMSGESDHGSAAGTSHKRDRLTFRIHLNHLVPCCFSRNAARLHKPFLLGNTLSACA